MSETAITSVGMLLIVIGLVALAWYLNKWLKEDTKAAQKRAQESAKKPRKRTEEKRKDAEEERVKAILEHKDEWGDVMCSWLVNKRYSLTDSRARSIMYNFAALGQETCIRLLQKTVAIGDSSGLVRLAWGEPTSVDEEVITEKENRYRWIYGVPRRGARYIWFKNGKVIKIKT
jgi:hypothetical protein